MTPKTSIDFPMFTGVRCLMMPYIQGDVTSIPQHYAAYNSILKKVFIKRGDIGFLTIDESYVDSGKAHRGARAKYGRALHTEVGRLPGAVYKWGGGGWGKSHLVTVDSDVHILLANNLDDSCAIWDSQHENTSEDGDIGYAAENYPYDSATLMRAGDVYEIGIFTPHESLPVKADCHRQFLRVVSAGVHGREEYFTENPLLQ